MLSAIVGALMGAIGLTSLLDAITGADVTTWFFEHIGSVCTVLLQPIFTLFCSLYDAILSVVRGIFS